MFNWHQKCGTELLGNCGGHVGEFECHLFLSSPTDTGDLTEDEKVVCADSTSHMTLQVGAANAGTYLNNPVATISKALVCGPASNPLTDQDCDGKPDTTWPSDASFGASCGAGLLGDCLASEKGSANWGCDESQNPVCLASDGSEVFVPSGDAEYAFNPQATSVVNGCSEDANCSGVLITTNQGNPITAVKQAVVVNLNGAITITPGLCENGVEACLTSATMSYQLSGSSVVLDSHGNPKTFTAPAGSEGVVQLNAAANSNVLGTQCTDSNMQVRTWQCDVSGGTAAVACTGPVQ